MGSPRSPTSLGTSDATTATLLGQGLAAEIMGQVSSSASPRTVAACSPPPSSPWAPTSLLMAPASMPWRGSC